MLCVQLALSSLLPRQVGPHATTSGGMVSRGTMLREAWREMQDNIQEHAHELEEARMLGYNCHSLPSRPWQPPDVIPFRVPAAATGMGPVCPFAFAADVMEPSATLPLIFETTSPIFSHAECQSIVEEARAHMAAGLAEATFSYNSTCHNVAVADLPHTLQFLNAEGFPRVAHLAGRCFGTDAIGEAAALRVYRGLIVHYDAAAGLTHQPPHRDHSLVTAVVPLNPRDEFEGGGTWLEALDSARAPPCGHALLQASCLRHAGHTIERGQRWVLVLFMHSERMRYGEHVRYFSARAQRYLAEGDDANARKYVHLTRAMCDDADPELKHYAQQYLGQELYSVEAYYGDGLPDRDAATTVNRA